MEYYPWWTEEQKGFAAEVEAFVESIMPRDAETRWTREFPWDIFEKIGEKGFTGAAIPKEYGGLGLGATGACIAMEEFCRMPGPGRVFGGKHAGRPPADPRIRDRGAEETYPPPHRPG